MTKVARAFFAKLRGQRITRLMARDGVDCWICGEPLDRKLRDCNDDRYITFDHIKPQSLGGLDQESNVRLAHRRCNQERGIDPIRPEDEGASHGVER